MLGEELSAILDHQQQLEQQFDQLTLNKNSKRGATLPQGTQEEIHGLSTSVHGIGKVLRVKLFMYALYFHSDIPLSP